MNKKFVLAAGVMTLMTGFAQAGSCSSSSVSCDKTSAAAHVALDEASFFAKLTQDHAVAFNLMNAEERLEVLTLAQKEDLTPDTAVDNFMSQHHVAVVEGTLKQVK